MEFTAFAGTRYEITARLVVRRVLDANTQDPLLNHPGFRGDSTERMSHATEVPLPA